MGNEHKPIQIGNLVVPEFEQIRQASLPLALSTAAPDAIKNLLAETPQTITQHFTPQELIYCNRLRVRPEERYAARLAGKQAVATILSLSETNWRNIEIVHGEFHAPKIVLHGNAAEKNGTKPPPLISLAHEKHAALAFATLPHAAVVEIGVDMCTRDAAQKSPAVLQGWCTDNEITQCEDADDPIGEYAARLAGKEAIIKSIEELAAENAKGIEILKVDGKYLVKLSRVAAEKAIEHDIENILLQTIYIDNIGTIAFAVSKKRSN